MTSASTITDSEFLARQRARLEALRDELLGSDAHARREVTAPAADGGAEAAELEDGAQRLEENEVRQNLENLHKVRIAAIDRALQRIEDGTYGYSEESGHPIPGPGWRPSPKRCSPWPRRNSATADSAGEAGGSLSSPRRDWRRRP